MKYYEMVQPVSGKDSTPEYYILSEEEIVNSEYGNYCCLMFLTRLGYLPSREHIIDEWIVVHWAKEI